MNSPSNLLNKDSIRDRALLLLEELDLEEKSKVLDYLQSLIISSDE